MMKARYCPSATRFYAFAGDEKCVAPQSQSRTHFFISNFEISAVKARELQYCESPLVRTCGKPTPPSKGELLPFLVDTNSSFRK